MKCIISLSLLATGYWLRDKMEMDDCLLDAAEKEVDIAIQMTLKYVNSETKKIKMDENRNFQQRFVNATK